MSVVRRVDDLIHMKIYHSGFGWTMLASVVTMKKYGKILMVCQDQKHPGWGGESASITISQRFRTVSASDKNALKPALMRHIPVQALTFHIIIRRWIVIKKAISDFSTRIFHLETDSFAQKKTQFPEGVYEVCSLIFRGCLEFVIPTRTSRNHKGKIQKTKTFNRE